MGMAKRFYDDAGVRAFLMARISIRSQAACAREIGVKPQNLSAMVKGGPIHGRVLEWLNFRRVEGLYERIK